MRLDGRTLGAVFLARHDRASADDRTLGELRILAAIAVPLLAQLRRHAPAARATSSSASRTPIVALRALDQARRRRRDLSALLHGPSGSGKELVARALHARERARRASR